MGRVGIVSYTESWGGHCVDVKEVLYGRWPCWGGLQKNCGGFHNIDLGVAGRYKVGKFMTHLVFSLQ
jgi:hypothetical protein